MWELIERLIENGCELICRFDDKDKMNWNREYSSFLVNLNRVTESLSSF